MSSSKDVKQRIDNVGSVEQIIKAMYMVASTKLVKVRKQLYNIRPIHRELRHLVEEVGRKEGAREHLYYAQRPVKNTLYIVFSGDKGMAGSYNATILNAALLHMEEGRQEQIVSIGSKGSEFFKRKNKNIIRSISDISDARVYYGSESLADYILEYYRLGKADEVYIAYSHFENVLSHEPVVERLLPIPPGTEEGQEEEGRLYEPDLTTFIDHTVPLYLHMSIFRAVSEAHTSEHASRMVNMDAAGKNASDIIEELSIVYNKQRQAAITQELTEIVGSSNAMKKGGIDDI